MRTRFVWAAVDHGVCREVLRDKRFGVTAPSDMELPRPLRALLERTDPGVANPVEPPAMVIVNPPDHTRYRQVVAQSFTPRATDKLGARVAEVTAELIDDLAGRPNPDLIADFAMRLPVAIIAEILDLPADSHDRMLEWGQCGAPLLDIGIGWKTYRNAIDGLRDTDGFFHEHIDRMRDGGASENPFSRMAADGTLTDRELAANAALIIGAGFETTVNLIGNGIALLLRHPDQLALLRDDPGLWPGAIEEILRLDSPVQMTARTASCDVEIAGHHIARGEMVGLFLGGANRDPAGVRGPRPLRRHPGQCPRTPGVRVRYSRLPGRRPGPHRGRHRIAGALRSVSRPAPHRSAAPAGAGQLARIRRSPSATWHQADRDRRTTRVELAPFPRASPSREQTQNALNPRD